MALSNEQKAAGRKSASLIVALLAANFAAQSPAAVTLKVTVLEGDKNIKVMGAVQLDAIRAALPEGQQREFDLYLRFPETRRDHPLVAIVQQAFGWTDAEVDALFVEADVV